MEIYRTPEIAEEVCERIARGESLRSICREEHMPTPAAIRKWARQSDEFGTQYTRACELRAEHWADEIIEISDSVRDSDNPAAIQAARLAADNRKWIASKLLHKQYGDSVTNKHVGDPHNPVTSISRVEVVFVRPEDRGTAGILPFAATNALQSGMGRSREREIALLCERLDSESDS